MAEKTTKAVSAEPVEESYLDLATREIVKVSPSGSTLRIKPESALFDFYVEMKTLPARNGDE